MPLSTNCILLKSISVQFTNRHHWIHFLPSQENRNIQGKTKRRNASLCQVTLTDLFLFKIFLMCFSGQEMAPTWQRQLLKHFWHQKWRLLEEQLFDPPIAYLTSVNVFFYVVPSSEETFFLTTFYGLYFSHQLHYYIFNSLHWRHVF